MSKNLAKMIVNTATGICTSSVANAVLDNLIPTEFKLAKPVVTLVGKFVIGSTVVWATNAYTSKLVDEVYELKDMIKAQFDNIKELEPDGIA